MEQSSSSSGAPSENGGVTSTTARTRQPSFRLNVQTLDIPSVAAFLQRFQRNLYRMLRILVTQVQISRLRNIYIGIRRAQRQLLEKIRRVQASVNETFETYNNLRKTLDETLDSVNCLWKDFLKTSNSRKAVQKNYFSFSDRLLRLKRNLAILNHNSSARSYRKSRLRQLIRKAKLGLARVEKRMSELDTVYEDKLETHRLANNEYRRAEVEFRENHGVHVYENLRRILVEAREEYDRENQTQEEQLGELRGALQNLRREHRMGVLRTVPLLQLDNQQQENVRDGNSGNTYEWQNLIFYTVDLVIEVRSVTWVYY